MCVSHFNLETLTLRIRHLQMTRTKNNPHRVKHQSYTFPSPGTVAYPQLQRLCRNHDTFEYHLSGARNPINETLERLNQLVEQQNNAGNLQNSIHKSHDIMS